MTRLRDVNKRYCHQSGVHTAHDTTTPDIGAGTFLVPPGAYDTGRCRSVSFGNLHANYMAADVADVVFASVIRSRTFLKVIRRTTRKKELNVVGGLTEATTDTTDRTYMYQRRPLITV